MEQNTRADPPPVLSAPRGLKVEYDHDLKVSEEFLSGFPRIRTLLRDDRLIEHFDFYNAEAVRCKKWFHRLGLTALVLGTIAILSAAVRLGVSEAVYERFSWIGLCAEAAGVVSVAILLLIKIRRFQLRWCIAVFCRERLRQWHFQKFLDGKLVSLFASDPQEFTEEFNRRWNRLEQEMRDGLGLMSEFVNSSSGDIDLFHRPTNYSNLTIASDVTDALLTLRLSHQLRFAKQKKEPSGWDSQFNIQERTVWSESIASSTLAAAVAVSALAVVASIGHSAHWGGWHYWLTTSRILGSVALVLAVLSAACRAYRAGFTIPDELESFEEYCDRAREMKATYLITPSDEEKINLLSHLEEEAATELRRYLRMKKRATFVN